MAKSDKPLEEVDLSRAFTPPRSVEWAGDKSINGFDTETADGRVFTVSVAWDGYGGVNQHNEKEPVTSKQIWEVLTDRKARSALNMWYNLDFDANVMLNHVLNKKQLAELTVSGHTETEEYEITYIRTKFLSIKDSNNHNYYHYDAAQFFYTSLEKAVTEWLDESKANDDINVEKFGLAESKKEVNKYIRDNWDDILYYAGKDAELVRDLWKVAVEVGEDLDIPLGQPFSTGYLAESYLNHHMKEKPGLGPRPMSKIAWDAYAGGRFEVIKRGDIGRVVGPDINSAYPAILSNLPDPKTLTWKQVKNPSIEDIEKADYGFINAVVSTDPNRAIQPFAVKDESQDKLVYPALDNTEITCIKDIFTHAYREGYLESFLIEDCWLGYDTGGAWYPFDFIPDLYKERKDAESQGLMKRGLLLKIVLNSMYGKTCQTTPKRRKLEQETELESHMSYVPELSLPKMIREKYKDGFIEELQAGAWFNPFLASYITGMTRLELHKRVTEYGLENNTVMLATDCLMVEEDAFRETSFKEDLVKSGLGNWDMEYAGEAFVIGAGIYQIDFDTCQKKDCGQYNTTKCNEYSHMSKVKTRGFKEADLDKGLVHAASKSNGHIQVESTRPRTVAEVIWSNDELGEVGKFLESERDIKADMDTKRQWGLETGFKELLEYTQESKPLVI